MKKLVAWSENHAVIAATCLCIVASGCGVLLDYLLMWKAVLMGLDGGTATALLVLAFVVSAVLTVAALMKRPMPETYMQRSWFACLTFGILFGLAILQTGIRPAFLFVLGIMTLISIIGLTKLLGRSAK